MSDHERSMPENDDDLELSWSDRRLDWPMFLLVALSTFALLNQAMRLSFTDLLLLLILIVEIAYVAHVW